ncbi:mannosyl-glycoprotein endo-beta-N-acetylglucosaminidase [Kitasatospora gansuensis]|uniref:Mannosyl-glycoprotein endo-beta-N-acetylglucosaminidase n=1 Tax=Kitasatospora gansuensis TaxID=258050 RepID=A0A7W7SJU3_9ACTN|nr:discoidin domain-containing protein [Kitasatospora gansuensis]MBB4951442.1 mannosyl-glycoprotein endo-beta-N-acetylglucosaminidase [Kitasatospora gansuensis]
MRRHVPLLLTTALTAAVLGIAPTSHATEGTAVTAAAGTQPFASYWYPSSILNWDPATDPDARFNRSRVPLRPRVSDPALKANTNARAGEGKIASLVSFGPTSNNPSQGSADPNYYAFGYWQYVDKLVFWGGSAGEGLILAPNPTVIDAAHRNGVKVYGTVFFPPTAYGGQLQWVRDFTQKSGTTYPVADKLAQAAQYYGFDGWFINQETDGGDAALATELRNEMRYARSLGPVEFMWYDAMTESGSVSWQNALTSANDAFLQESAKRTSDSMFVNFGWSSSGLNSSRTLARSLGRSEYELYSGIDTEANGYNTSVSWGALFPAGQPHTTSLGLYRPEWTWKSATDRADFYAKDSRYWVGANADPANTTTSSSWKGLANYVAESSPITAKPFVTSFGTGQGDFYNSGGVRVGSTGWNNLSLQDVPPTYHWSVSSTGSRLTPSIDFTDAYEGGSSLRLTGTLDATNTVRLYQTQLPVAADTKLSVTLKTPTARATNLRAAVAFTDAPTSFTTLDLGSTTGSGWETRTLDLSAYAGKTIAQIGLQTVGSMPSFDLKIGQLRVYDGLVDTAAAPTALTVLGSTDVSATRKSLRLAWTASAAGSVHHYEVYRRNADGTRTFLGATPNDAYFVQQLDRVGTEAATTLDVEAVSTELGRSTATSTAVGWSTVTESNLALNRPATASSQCNTNEGAAKAVNGSVSGGNSDKWCALTASPSLEVDLGSVRPLTRFTVKHAAAGGESASWNTRDFTVQVRNATTDPWTTATTVTGNTAAVTNHPVGLTARYVRLVVTKPTQTTDPATRIYEFEAWGS